MFFHENFTDFDRVFGVSDENGTYYDRESYVLDPKLTLTCNALRRKVPILYRIGKKYSASSASRVKKIPSVFTAVFLFQNIMKIKGKANLKNIFVSPYPTLFIQYGSVGKIIFFYFSLILKIHHTIKLNCK